MATVTIESLQNPLFLNQDYTLQVLQDTSTTLPFDYPIRGSNIGKGESAVTFKVFNYGSNEVTITIKVTCQTSSSQCNEQDLQRVTKTQLYEPERAILGTNNTYPIIIPKSQFSGMMLPTNLKPHNQDVFVDFVINTLPEDGSYASIGAQENIFDTSYFNNVDLVVLPWIPFFTHCEKHDQRIVLYDLLEQQNKESCNYIPADQTKVLQSIPTSGFVPTADNCDISLKCQHLNIPANKQFGQMWYTQFDNKVLFYLYKFSMTIDQMIKERNDTGTLIDFQKLVTDESPELIPVQIKTVGRIDNGYPLMVTLKIEFFQASTMEKQLVKASLVLSEYVEKAQNSHAYTLKIQFQAIDYVGMLDSFNAGVLVYFFVFLVLSIVLSLAIYLLYWANKLIFTRKKKKRVVATLKFTGTFQETFMPQAYSAMYSNTIGILFFIFFMTIVVDLLNIQTMVPIINKQSVNSQDWINARRGRMGLITFIFGVIMIIKGSKYLISVPTKEEARVIEENMDQKEIQEEQQLKSSQRFHKQQTIKVQYESHKTIPSTTGMSTVNAITTQTQIRETAGDDLNPLMANNIPNMDNFLKDPTEIDTEQLKLLETQRMRELDFKKVRIQDIINGHEIKRQHFILVSLFTSLILLYIISPSRSSSTSGTATLYIILLLFADVASILVLKHYIMKEILLLAPITMAFEIVQFMFVMREDNFSTFLLTYLLRMILIFLFRIYIDPILKNSEVYIRRFIKWLSMSPRLHFLINYIDNNIEQREEKQLKSIENILEKKVKVDPFFNIEYINFTLVNYTTKQAARFMFPILLFFHYVFPNETNIKKLYNINQSEIVYYIIFWLFMLLPSFFIDIYLLNILEIFHGYKLYDYLAYSNTRFKLRTTNWIGDTRKMDKAVSPEHRSIHNFCFSKQFYFSITIAAWGILLLMLGLYMIISNSYIPFSDSALLPLICIQALVNTVSSFILSRVKGIVNPWKIPKPKSQIPLQMINVIKDELEQRNDVIKMMQTEFFRSTFVSSNKDWIIQKLSQFVDIENFYDNEGYLIKVYQSLVDEEEMEKKERQRRELIYRRKQEHMEFLTIGDFMKKNAEPNSQTYLDNKMKQMFQREQDPIQIKKSIIPSMTHILYHWYNFANQNMYLRDITHQITKSQLLKNCQECGQQYTLKVVSIRPMTELLAEYRVQKSGLPFNKYEWRDYFIQHQEFKTLCDECEVLHVMKKMLEGRKQRDKVEEQEMKKKGTLTNPAELRKKNVPIVVQKALQQWHSLAGSRVLHKVKNNFLERNAQPRLGNQAPKHTAYKRRTPSQFPSSFNTSAIQYGSKVRFKEDGSGGTYSDGSGKNEDPPSTEKSITYVVGEEGIKQKQFTSKNVGRLQNRHFSQAMFKRKFLQEDSPSGTDQSPSSSKHKSKYGQSQTPL